MHPEELTSGRFNLQYAYRYTIIFIQVLAAQSPGAGMGHKPTYSEPLMVSVVPELTVQLHQLLWCRISHSSQNSTDFLFGFCLLLVEGR